MYDNSYSRFVALTKLILPIIALGILSTLFLFSRNIDPTQSIPYADVDVEELAREQRIGAPNYAGVTEDGAAISITAKSVRPSQDNAKIVPATGLTAIIEDAMDGRIEIIADDGVIDTDQQFVTLQGGVQILTSTGYIINTAGVTAALNETSVVTDGRITAEGPLGTLNAGQMTLETQKGADGSHLLVFKGGVKLIYDPKGS
jgi:lipopolysaccharide export system protein LptC